MKKILLVILLIAQYTSGDSQVSLENINDSKIQRTCSALYNFLLSNPTDTAINVWAMKTDQYAIYDSAMNLLFSAPYSAEIKKVIDSNKQSNIYTQYQALYAIDYAIDFVPKDSIFFQTKEEFRKEDKSFIIKDSNEYKDHLFAGFLIKNEFYPLMDLKFDKNGKFIFILPLLNFDDHKSKIVSDFLDRQKKSLRTSL